MIKVLWLAAAYVATHPSLQRPARLFMAALWAREEGSRRLSARGGPLYSLRNITDAAAVEYPGGQTYWYNTQTGVSQWEPPPTA